MFELKERSNTMTVLITRHVAKQINQVSDDFDNDFDQNFLKINEKLARHLSRVGANIYNYLINLLDDKTIGDKFCISDKIYYKIVNYLSALYYINTNHLNNVNDDDLGRDDSMIDSVLTYLLIEPINMLTE